jgi:ABC-type lipoprotein export system ATPase subunit
MRLTAERITHRFKGQPGNVLSDVSMVASSGGMLAITGPSGSGKSTLLSVLGLILAPGAGRVSWDGICLTGRRALPSVRAGLFGWVTQASHVFSSRSVVDNVAVAVLGQGMDHETARRAAMPALETVGLGHRARAPAGLLSGGEAQRLTVARMMLAAKPVLLADEPTGQLDRANTDLVVDTLRAAAGRGAAVVIATHDQRVAGACDERLELVDGRVTWGG